MCIWICFKFFCNFYNFFICIITWICEYFLRINSIICWFCINCICNSRCYTIYICSCIKYNIDTSFLTENNLKNEIFYTRTDINGITSGITTTINTKSTDNRAYTTEIFTNSSNYINEEIVQVTSELETYSDTQILTALNNSSL